VYRLAALILLTSSNAFALGGGAIDSEGLIGALSVGTSQIAAGSIDSTKLGNGVNPPGGLSGPLTINGEVTFSSGTAKSVFGHVVLPSQSTFTLTGVGSAGLFTFTSGSDGCACGFSIEGSANTSRELYDGGGRCTTASTNGSCNVISLGGGAYGLFSGRAGTITYTYQFLGF